MAREEIGDQAASLNQRVLFYRGHILVDAVFSEVSVMSAASLRELAGELPRPGGNAGNLPPILAFMPHHGYQSNTEKYAEGPLGLGAISSPLPLAASGFRRGPEVVLGQYSTSSGPATLMLIEYPTPALAAEHLRRIDAANHAAQPQAGVEAVENIGPFFDKRTGPIIAIAAGPLSQSDAQTLLGAVNYEASVTWNENTYFDKKNNIANLLVNIFFCASLWVRSLWRRESRSAAPVFSCVAISPVPSSDEPTKPSSSRWTCPSPPAPELRPRIRPLQKAQTGLK
jgi:hypothetical protein